MLEYEIEKTIDKIIDELNFFPPKSYFLELLSIQFTLDEIITNIDIIENYYYLLERLITA